MQTISRETVLEVLGKTESSRQSSSLELTDIEELVQDITDIFVEAKHRVHDDYQKCKENIDLYNLGCLLFEVIEPLQAQSGWRATINFAPNKTVRLLFPIDIPSMDTGKEHEYIFRSGQSLFKVYEKTKHICLLNDIDIPDLKELTSFRVFSTFNNPGMVDVSRLSGELEALSNDSTELSWLDIKPEGKIREPQTEIQEEEHYGKIVDIAEDYDRLLKPTDNRFNYQVYLQCKDFEVHFKNAFVMRKGAWAFIFGKTFNVEVYHRDDIVQLKQLMDVSNTIAELK